MAVILKTSTCENCKDQIDFCFWGVREGELGWIHSCEFDGIPPDCLNLTPPEGETPTIRD